MVSRVTTALFPRLIARRLAEALEDSPVVLIHGPRQCGKTTLAQVGFAPHELTWDSGGLNRDDDGFGWDALGLEAIHRDYAYVTFDDGVVREGARADPSGFVAELPERVILDEVQRVPGLFTALKVEVDRRRVPGRFILTGSTNILLVPELSDSLAGRVEIIRLHPLAQAELARAHPGTDGFLDVLFAGGFRPRSRPESRLGDELVERIVAGGFAPALRRPTGRRRNWYRDYVEAQVQRDARDLARIRMPEVLGRLLNAAASQTARLFNLSDLAAPLELTRPAVGGYVSLLERLFLLERLPPWHSNRLSRLVKTAKLHIGDTGLGAAVLGLDDKTLAADRALYGQFVETFVFQELRRQASWADAPVSFFHFRDRYGSEVDVVIQRGLQFAGLEIKASATVTKGDFQGLRKLAGGLGERFVVGVVLYDGERVVPFGDRLRAVPLRRLWEP